MRNENGVTLIALILAFVVLVLLGAIAITLCVNETKEVTSANKGTVNSYDIELPVEELDDESSEVETEVEDTDATETEKTEEDAPVADAKKVAEENTVDTNTVEEN